MTPAAIERTDLRIERNAAGDPVRVYIGPLDVTHLVARVQSNTTSTGTVIEVVLSRVNGRGAPYRETKG